MEKLIAFVLASLIAPLFMLLVGIFGAISAFVTGFFCWLVWTHWGLGHALFPSSHAVWVAPGYLLVVGVVYVLALLGEMVSTDKSTSSSSD